MTTIYRNPQDINHYLIAESDMSLWAEFSSNDIEENVTPAEIINNITNMQRCSG